MQIQFNIKQRIQEKAKQLLESDNFRFEAMVGFMKVDGVVEPTVVIADEIPNNKEFYNELYDLFNRYFDLKKIRDESIKQ